MKGRKLSGESLTVVGATRLLMFELSFVPTKSSCRVTYAARFVGLGEREREARQWPMARSAVSGPESSFQANNLCVQYELQFAHDEYQYNLRKRCKI